MRVSSWASSSKLLINSLIAGVVMLSSLLMSAPAFAATTTVTPVSSGGWTGFSEAAGTGGGLRYVSGPSGATGNGSAELHTSTAADGYLFAKYGSYGGTKLADLSALSYRTFVDQGNNTIAPAFQVNIDDDVTDTDTSWKGRLVYEPYKNGSVIDNQWQAWDAKTGNWWLSPGTGSTAAFGATYCRQANPCSLATLLADHPNIGVSSSQPLIGFKVGSGWTTPFNGYVDSLNFGPDSYDFEPVLVGACTTTTTLKTTDLSTWDTSQTRLTGHNEITADGLRVYTESNTSTDKAAGYYATDFNLSDMGDQVIADSIDYSPAFGITPGLQMQTDFDNDGTVDGILVGESVYGNDWWLANGSAFVQNGAPNTGGGSGSAWYGTPDEWLESFPNAKVKAIGYSLGSGVYGDGVIKRITLGCINYTFGLPEPPVTAPSPTPVITVSSAQTTGGDSSTNGTSNDGAADDSQVLGADASISSTSTDDGNNDKDVKGATDEDKKVQESSNFLGLGWWWIPLIVAAILLFLAWLRRRNQDTTA